MSYTRSKQTAATQGRKWYREHFYDHPAYIEADQIRRAPAMATKDKVKVWCKRCFERRVKEEDQHARLHGVPREEHEIEKSLWALASTTVLSRRWITARSTDILVHLRDCDLWKGSNAQEQARGEHEMQLTRRRARGEEPETAPVPIQPPPFPYHLQSPAVSSNQPIYPVTPSSVAAFPSQSILSSLFISPFGGAGPSGMSASPASYSPSPLLAGSLSCPVLAPSPTPSWTSSNKCTDSPLTGSPMPSAKRSRLSRSVSASLRHSGGTTGASPSPGPPIWDNTHQ